MKPGFVISGCAEAAPVASAESESVISVSSSTREVEAKATAPGMDGPPIIPEKGPESMVCVKAARSSQTPPLMVPDIFIVFWKGRAFFNALTISWTMVSRILNAIIVNTFLVPYTDIRP